tara:strand:- start:12945 stop:15446 length:2502 start_codon:yes stop_codon:yes gene_type:complete
MFGRKTLEKSESHDPILSERYLPLISFIIIFILIGVFSFKISFEVKELTNSINNFYEHPYQVRTTIRDFHLTGIEIVLEWKSQIQKNSFDEDSKESISSKFQKLDNDISIINEKYLGPREETESLSKSYQKLRNYIYPDGKVTTNIEDQNKVQIETQLLLNEIVEDLKPIELFAIGKAEEFISQSDIEKGHLLDRLTQLYIGIALFLIVGTFVIGYLMTKKNLNIFSEKEKFKKSILFAPIPIMIHKNGVVLQLSKEWIKLSGYTKKEIPTIEEWSRRAFGEAHIPRKEYIMGLYKLKEPQSDGDWTIKTNSGEERIWRFHTGPLGNNTVVSTAIDVTYDVRNQERIEHLNKETLKLAKVVEQSPVSIVITDVKGDIEYVNEYFSELTGYSSEEAIGQNPKILKSGLQDQDFYKNLWETISSGENWYGSLQNRAKDGSIYWESASISPILSNDGNIINYVAVKENITERIRSEEALKKSEKKYRDLFTLSTDACLLLKDGIYIDCNKAALSHLGMSRKDQLIGLKPSDIAPEYQADGKKSDNEVKKIMLDAADKKHVRFEWLHKRVDGGVVPAEILLTKIEEGEEDFLYVVWRDITARKEFEKQLKENIKEKEVLLAEIHHRVKNNLAVISGMLELQAFSSKNSKEVDELAKSVYRIKSIAIIHEQLYKTGNFAAISIDKSIKHQIEGLLKMYNGQKGLNVKVSYDMQPVNINVNQAIPFGLLVNELATNAFKYAYKGIDKPELRVSLTRNDDTIRFIIKDNGIGFDVEQIKNAEDSLGYTLIEAFVAQLMGELDINSSPEEGTRITITFKPILKKGSSSNFHINNKLSHKND